MRISDWSSDVCSSDLRRGRFVEQQDRRITQQRARDRDPLALPARQPRPAFTEEGIEPLRQCAQEIGGIGGFRRVPDRLRSEEHTSELQSLMRISYAVFCLTKKNKRYT